MSFLSPLFLLGSLAVAIPVLIHLFNLRRYKRVSFPDTRFLKDIQLSTKRQAKIKQWQLLLCRCLFLLALALAFAQPLLNKGAHEGKAGITVLYIDNSMSMSMRENAESLLQTAQKRARDLVRAAPKDSRFLVLSNDKGTPTRPVMAEEALSYIDALRPVPFTLSLKNVFDKIEVAQENEKNESWEVWVFSDMQQATLLAQWEKRTGQPIAHIYLSPIRFQNASNLYVDTAYFLTPGLDANQPNKLVARIGRSGPMENHDESVTLRALIDGQVRTVGQAKMGKDGLAWDTLELRLDKSGWQELKLAIEDHPLGYDDTFRIAIRTLPDLSVLVLADGPLSPYLQAAFKAPEGFRAEVRRPEEVSSVDWGKYNLVILQNIHRIPPSLQTALTDAFQAGRNVMLFPGRVSDLNSYNQALETWAGLSLGPADTVRQQVASLQREHPLVQDLFERVPENVQLPFVSFRYPVLATMRAQQQALMNFKDGRPFLAQFRAGQGRLYICASPLDEQSSGFPTGHYFMPVLYKVAIQSSGSNMNAIAMGSPLPLWLPLPPIASRSVWHLSGNGWEGIPSQRPSGSGVDLFIGNIVPEAGFYRLYTETAPDSFLVAVNADRKESDLAYADRQEMVAALGPYQSTWIDNERSQDQALSIGKTTFPLWKAAVLLALLALAGETYFLTKKDRRPMLAR